MTTSEKSSTCPAANGKQSGFRARDWWPDQLDLAALHQHSRAANPLDADFDYATAFSGLDLDALRGELFALMHDSQPWWPADYGHYGPLFVRMAWHSAGTYRISDGRGGADGGAQRLAPLNSWPDNASLDKARRLLWPIKQRYGASISWGDLMIFAGNCALESMGFKTFGFGGGREDIWEPEDIYWGPEGTWLGDERYSGARVLEETLGAAQMGLIYVNPEGPNGDPDPLAAAVDIRETFARMAMDDEETVALIAGGHTFGKTHGAVSRDHIGAAPDGAPLEQQGLGWHNSAGAGNGALSWTSGLEGAWTANPVQWDNGFFANLFEYEWELSESPDGAKQWVAKDAAAQQSVPDAHDPALRHAPVMLTTDLALRFDPLYEPISRRFYEQPEQFAEAFAKAWYKLTHRDMGPPARQLGPLVPPEPQVWQDPVPAVEHALIDDQDVAALKSQILDCGLSTAELVRTAWSSASTFRGTDKRGGANGARIVLSPQCDWEVNRDLKDALRTLGQLQRQFNAAQQGEKRLSLADIIVLGGCAAIERAAAAAGHPLQVPFTPGRGDATPELTDADSFAVLEPKHDGFINHLSPGLALPAEQLLLERANLLTLSAPEMTVLIGGMRALGANIGESAHGVLSDRPGALSNDFFVNLLDMDTQWAPSAVQPGLYEGRGRADGALRWSATAVDLVFGANAQLRAIAEVYASDDASAKFARDFIAAWDRVMNLDRFDLKHRG